jgi:hypothetical protein
MTTGSIVLDTCRSHFVTPEEFFDRRTRRSDVIACRLEAIARLRAAGFTKAGVSRAVRLHYDTIRYWTNPDHRKRKIARMHVYNERRAAQ